MERLTELELQYNIGALYELTKMLYTNEGVHIYIGTSGEQYISLGSFERKCVDRGAIFEKAFFMVESLVLDSLADLQEATKDAILNNEKLLVYEGYGDKYHWDFTNLK